MARWLFWTGLLMAVPLPAFANGFAKGLHAEFEKKDLDAALAAYEDVRTGDDEEIAAAACYRMMACLAKKGDKDGVLSQIILYKKAFVGSRDWKTVLSIEEDPDGFIARMRPKDKKADIEKLLAERKVTLNFDDIGLDEAVQFLEDISGLNFFLAVPGEDIRISLRLNNITLENALNLMIGNADAGLAWGVASETVVIAPNPSALAPPSFTVDQIGKAPFVYVAIKERLVTLNFPDVPLSDAVTFLQDITGENFVVGKGVDEETTIAVRLKEVKLESALTLMLARPGLTYKLENGAAMMAPK